MTKALKLKGLSLGASLLLLVSYQNCSGKKDTADASSECQECELDPGVLDYNPKISCDIRDGVGTLIRTITSTSNSQSSSRPFRENETLDVDCRKSTAWNGASSAQVSLNIGSAPAVLVPNGSKRYRLTFSMAGTYPLSVVASDADGNTVSKAVEARVSCSASAPQPNVSQVVLVADSAASVGYYNYRVTGGVTGGTPPYMYAWDFNGDASSDLFRNPGGSSDIVWSANSFANNVFNHYFNYDAGNNTLGKRRVRLLVVDSCNIMKEVSQVVNFNSARLPANQFPTEMAYHYMQAEVRDKNAATSSDQQKLVKNVDHNSLSAVGTPDNRIHVKCNYNVDFDSIDDAGFFPLEVQSKNFYGSPSNDGLRHGMTLEVSNIDNLATGIQENRNISKLKWTTANAGDVATRVEFSKSNTMSCAARVQMIKRFGSAPCATGPAVPSVDITFLGEYSCPTLSSAGDGEVQVTNGKFYCAVAKADQCAGGGGGGGGEDPPPQ